MIPIMLGTATAITIAAIRIVIINSMIEKPWDDFLYGMTHPFLITFIVTLMSTALKSIQMRGKVSAINGKVATPQAPLKIYDAKVIK